MRYRFKTHEVEAFQWKPDGPFPDRVQWPDWFKTFVDSGEVLFERQDLVVLYHMSRCVKVRPGYYVYRLQKTNQEITASRPEQFEHYYEKAEAGC